MIRAFRAVPQTVRDWATWIASLETQGSFTATLTGYASSPTGSVEWVKLGRRVTLTASSAISGTSNATSFTLTGVPDAIAANTARTGVVEATDAGASVVALASISGTTITFSTDAPFSASGWTASGTKGLPAGWQFTYLLEE